MYNRGAIQRRWLKLSAAGSITGVTAITQAKQQLPAKFTDLPREKGFLQLKSASKIGSIRLAL